MVRAASKPEGGRVTDIEARGPEENGDDALVARICWHYYKAGQTQDVIPPPLKSTRKRVNQILGEARERGIVRISIASRFGPCSELEARLVERFKLRSAIV